MIYKPYDPQKGIEGYLKGVARRTAETMVAKAKDEYNGVGTPKNPFTKVVEGGMIITQGVDKEMRNRAGYVFLYYALTSDERFFIAHYLKLDEFYDMADGRQRDLIQVDKDHRIHAFIYRRNLSTGKLHFIKRVRMTEEYSKEAWTEYKRLKAMYP
ncbi:hypothetical protein FACS1894124_0740 [Spirochaetia bacterium]|nr:hypothetical protein FACS1894124_0740 [Spirochaetia bacterium]